MDPGGAAPFLEEDTDIEEHIWYVLMDEDAEGEPIHSDKTSEFFRRGHGVPFAPLSFFEELPREIVETNLWPRLMDGGSDVSNYQICTILCAVCTAWLEFVDDRREYRIGDIALAAQKYHERHDVESDSDWES